MRHSTIQILSSVRQLISKLLAFTFATVMILSLSNVAQVSARQATVPSEITNAETTVLAKIDANLIDVVQAEVSKLTADKKETLLDRKIQQTKEILAGEPVWVTTNWPQVPMKMTLSIVDQDDSRIDRLSKLWGIQNGKLGIGQHWGIALQALKPDSEKPKTARDLTWQKLFTEAPKAPITIAFQPPERFYATLEELVDELPDYLGGGPVTLLTEGALSATVTVDPATWSVDGAVQSKDGDAANKLADHLAKLLQLESTKRTKQNLAEFLRLDGAEPSGEDKGGWFALLPSIMKETSVTTDQSTIRIRYAPKNVAAGDRLARRAVRSFLGPIAEQSQLQKLRTQMQKLRNVTIGILNFESAYGYFPPPLDSRGPDGKSKLSWRVYLLPFLGESNLFQQFKLDEPWDSPANIKLLPLIPDVYSRFPSRLLTPVDAPEGMTTLVAPVSDKTILGSGKKVGFGNITDGSSNTVLLVVVKDSLAVPWTAPQDYQFDRDTPESGLQFEIGKTPIALGDGSSFLAGKDNQWLHLFEMNDGNIVRL